MCDIATGIMAVSAAMGAAGALHEGAAADAAGKGEAALYRAQAASRLQKAEYDAELSRRKYERSKGTVEARAAGEGVDMQNFYDILADDAEEAALERAAIRWSAQSESAMLEYQAGAAERRGKDAKTASYFKAAGAVVGAFSPAIKARYAKEYGVSISDSESGYRALK